MDSFIATVNNFTGELQTLGPIVGGLVLAAIGIAYTLAKDPQKKEMLNQWLLNVGVGLVILVLATSIIHWGTSQIAG